MLIISFFFQALLLNNKPFEENSDNYFKLFNEVCVTIYLYIMLCLTDFQGQNNLREEQGWALIILLGTVILVNLVKAIT